MKESELRNAINVETIPIGPTLVNVIASIEIHATAAYDINAGPAAELEKRAREDAIERLMRTIYEDQRQEMFTAIQDFLMVSPFDYNGLVTAREKLMRVAMLQKPST
jgi:hypothetical protein